MQEYQKFLKQFRLKHFKKGEIILCQGERPGCAYAVKSGIVKSYNLTTGGEEKPIGFDKPGDIFPIACIFGHARCGQYYYEAFTDCVVRCIPNDEYVRYLREHPVLMMTLFDDFVSRYTGAQMRINALEQSKASLKVINTLHFFCLRYGEKIKTNAIRVQLPLTQQDFANFVGLTRETTGIELKKLQQAGLLTCHKQSYIIHADKLRELLDQDYDLGVAAT